MPSISVSLFRFVKFSAVGVLCAGLNLVILWTATCALKVHYLIATLVSFLIVNLIGYYLNRRITFQDRELKGEGRVRRYYLVMGGSLILNLAMMALLIDGAGLSVISSSIVVTVALTLLNFCNHSGWTFASGLSHSETRTDGK